MHTDATTTAEHFLHLQQQPEPLLLPNIWDPASAVLAQTLGAKAVATSSAALAWALGYQDGEQLPLAELQRALQRILRVCRVPLSVDLEQGYSADPTQVAALVLQLAEAGVAGLNLEDGVAPAELLAGKIRACRVALAGRAFFINARTDVFLRVLAQGEEAVVLCRQRGLRYQAAGADALFVPGLNCLETAQQISRGLNMPVNLMGWPDGASAAQLADAGVRRISAGPALFLKSMDAFTDATQAFLHQAPRMAPLDCARFDALF
ncbi:MAG: isocitrate lyase/phosphoenolpyruvate mutase family protein [Rheinheimera sp.]|nr:isocitrate lyase/phosphoenolpyruvate mutase family protein [Rheinheimera sp.]